jgi:hypothetical protein
MSILDPGSGIVRVRREAFGIKECGLGPIPGPHGVAGTFQELGGAFFAAAVKIKHAAPFRAKLPIDRKALPRLCKDLGDAPGPASRMIVSRHLPSGTQRKR